QPLGPFRPDGECPIETLDRLTVAFEIQQGDTPLYMGLRFTRKGLDGAIQRSKRLGMAPESHERRAATDQIRHGLLAQPTQSVVVTQCFRMLLQQRVRYGAVMKRFN